MNIYKNPFAIRASERIETDEMFLELFSSEPLTHLEEKYEQDKLWNNVTTILSSPGAGKTTLLRLYGTQYGLQKTEKVGSDRQRSYQEMWCLFTVRS